MAQPLTGELVALRQAREDELKARVWHTESELASTQLALQVSQSKLAKNSVNAQKQCGAVCLSPDHSDVIVVHAW